MKLKDINSLINDLNDSVGAHYQWLVQVLAFAIKPHEITAHTVCSGGHNHCQFGKWLNVRLTHKSESNGFLIDIRKKHIVVHDICTRLLLAVKQNKHIEITPLLNKFENSLREFIASVTRYQTHLQQLRSGYDPLTELPLRRVLDESFTEQMQDQSNGELYVLLLDIDHFKKINDTFGHQTGDSVLKIFAQRLRAGVRHYEPLYRYGGEEFVMIIKAWREQNALDAARRITHLVSSTPFTIGHLQIPVTITAGLTRTLPGDVLRTTLARADSAMYMGKNAGRNRCIYHHNDKSIDLVAETALPVHQHVA